MTITTRMLQRRGNASQWTSSNPVLGNGEIGFESDTNKFKIGNGSAAWTDLVYQGGSVNITGTSPIVIGGTSSAPVVSLSSTLPATTFSGDVSGTNLTLSGNLVVNGTQTIVNTSNLAIADSIIYLADTQYASDLLDIGIYGAYGSSGGDVGNHKHTGIVRDHLDGVWKIFSNGSEVSGNDVNFTGVTYDSLLVGSIKINGGTSSQFLKADGSIDSNTYITLTPSATQTIVPANNTTTGLVLNSPTGTSANLFDVQKNGASQFKVESSGFVTVVDLIQGRRAIFGTRDSSNTVALSVRSNDDGNGNTAIQEWRDASNTIVATIGSGGQWSGAVVAGLNDISGRDITANRKLQGSYLALDAGTTTQAPINLTAGINRTTPLAGAIEFDGVNFYKTNASAVRAASISSHIFKKATSITIGNVSTASSILAASTAASASTGIALAAATTYEFEVRFVLTTTGTTSHTEAVGFYYSGTTSFYHYEIERKVANIATSAVTYAQIANGTTLTSNLTSTVMTPAITTTQTNAIYVYRGWITTNTAGNWTPTLQFSASPGATSTIGAGATVKITPMQSTSGNVNISSWA